MSLKDSLRRFKGNRGSRNIVDNTDKKNNESNLKQENCNLNNKIEHFLNWSFDNMWNKKGDISINLKNFIEKMAVWYELRYPDYEINRLIPYFSSEEKSVSEEMFANNSYIQKVFGPENDVAYLDWDKFYNTSAFVNSLSFHEKFLLRKPTYKDRFYLDPSYITCVHLTKRGVISCVDNLNYVTNDVILDVELEGVHVKNFISVLKKNGVTLEDDSEIKNVIKDYEKQVYFKEELLNCVMYKIIERGGSDVLRISFAKYKWKN